MESHMETMATYMDRVTLTTEVVRIFQQTLTRLGFCQRTADGGLWQVAFRDVGYYPPADAAVLTVDVHRLPRKVTTLALADSVTIHELSTAIGGYLVQAINSTGMLYVVRYTPPQPAMVKLPKCVDFDLTSRPITPYAVPLGADCSGRVRWQSLLRLLNVLIGGAPGGGKSMLLNTWLAALAQAHPASELRLSLIDPKGVELHGWRDLPQVLGQIAETPVEAGRTLELLRDEIDRRKRLFQSVGARSLPSYNHLVPQASLPLHLVVIDELTDLTIQAGGPKSDLFMKLISAASIGRALGILFVLATQSPRAEIVNGDLKAVMNTRIAFRTASREDSRVIMDRADAADLPADRPGRMVMMLDGGVRVYRSCHLSDETLHAFQGTRQQADLLTPGEQRVLKIALDDLGGAFAVNEIYARTGPASRGGVSKRWLEHLAAAWEAKGWLVHDGDPTHPRRVDTGVVAPLMNASIPIEVEGVSTP
jgi:DNA segregation ATPase FtsK/SpoIIIE-like protein